MQADLRLCWSHIPHCWKPHALAHIILTLVYFQLTQQLEDLKKVVDGKEADIGKLKTSLDQSGKEMKQLQNQHAKDLEKATSEKEKLERYGLEVNQVTAKKKAKLDLGAEKR